MPGTTPSHTPEAIAFNCGACGAKIKTRPQTAGRRGRCPKCGASVTVPSAPTPAVAPTEAPAGTAQPDSLLDDLAAAEVRQPATASKPPARGARCPACKAPLAASAVLCVSCGTDLKTGRQHHTAPAAERTMSRVTELGRDVAASAGSLLRGSIASAVGATIGAVAWVFVAVKTGYQLSLIAWILGGLAGLGMYLAHRQPNGLSGLIAGTIALASILVARITIIQLVLHPNVDMADLIIGAITSVDPKAALFAILAVGTAYWVGAHGPELSRD